MNIENLSFDDNSFDFTRAERVLLYAPNPIIAIKELFRVTKKNSYICIIEPDWETNTTNVNNRELVRKIINHDCDNNIKNGLVGRELPSILKNLNINYSIDSRVARLPQQLALNFYLGVAKSAFENNTISEHLTWIKEITELFDAKRLFCTISYFLFICDNISFSEV